MSLKVYKAVLEGENTVTIRVDSTFRGFEVDKFVRMLFNMSVRKEWDKTLKDIKLLEAKADNTERLFEEVHIDPLITSRVFIKEMLHFNNKDDLNLVKRFDLQDKKNYFHAVIANSVNDPNVPLKHGDVRGNLIREYWLIEDDLYELNTIHVRNVSTVDYEGEIPKYALNQMAVDWASTRFESFLDGYHTIYFSKTA